MRGLLEGVCLMVFCEGPLPKAGMAYFVMLIVHADGTQRTVDVDLSEDDLQHSDARQFLERYARPALHALVGPERA